MKTIGCIGCGNMGGAIMRGVSELGRYDRLLGVDHTPAKVKACGAEIVDMATLSAEADVLVVAVKPYAVKEVVREFAAAAPDGKKSR